MIRKTLLAILLFAPLAIAPRAQADVLGDIHTGSSVIHSDILQGLAAKELCTCMYVIRVGDAITPPITNRQRMNICISRSELPISASLLKSLIWIDVDSHPNEVRVGTTLAGDALGEYLGSGATARFEGDDSGCRLLTDEERAHDSSATR